MDGKTLARFPGFSSSVKARNRFEVDWTLRGLSVSKAELCSCKTIVDCVFGVSLNLKKAQLKVELIGGLLCTGFIEQYTARHVG